MDVQDFLGMLFRLNEFFCGIISFNLDAYLIYQISN